MLSPATLLVSAVTTAVFGAGPALAQPVPVARTSPAAPTVAAPGSSRCARNGHHRRCHQTHGNAAGGEHLSDQEATVIGAALVALSLAAL